MLFQQHDYEIDPAFGGRNNCYNRYSKNGLNLQNECTVGSGKLKEVLGIQFFFKFC